MAARVAQEAQHGVREQRQPLGHEAVDDVVALSARAPGRYRLSVQDRSAAHNFHLVGPGVNRRTGIGYRGTVTWLLNLRSGAYRYGSDAVEKKRTLTVR